MGFLQKIKAALHDDWCDKCTCPMELQKKQLYALPMTVGHYQTHEDASYYLNNAVKVDKKADIPTGVYACGTYIYKCPSCNKAVVKVSVFLPVRDQEQYEASYLFEDPQLETFIRSGKTRSDLAESQAIREE